MTRHLIYTALLISIGIAVNYLNFIFLIIFLSEPILLLIILIL